MIPALVLIPFLYLFSIPILNGLKKKHDFFDIKLMKNLFWYHLFFIGVYYVFALYSPSDSAGYFYRPGVWLGSWYDLYGTGTTFIDFLGYPFISKMKFTYEMMMVLFGWLGYWGFVYFYIFFKENLEYLHQWKGYDLLTIIFFLPNMHYWTSSLGKGSIIFWGLGLAIYGLSNLKQRKLPFLIGLTLVYFVRPHVFLVMLAGILVGFFTGKQKVPLYQKVIVVLAGVVAMVLLFDKIMAFSKLDSDNLLESFDQLSSHRATELSKSGSGIDINSYPLIFKLFTFWYRPLFIDSPGTVGFLVSFENLLYLGLSIQLFKKDFLRFFFRGSALIKTCAVVFLGISIALSGTLSNLGIIIRQKSMVMYFFLFIIISFMDYKKSKVQSDISNDNQEDAQETDTSQLNLTI